MILCISFTEGALKKQKNYRALGWLLEDLYREASRSCLRATSVSKIAYACLSLSLFEIAYACPFVHDRSIL